MRNREPEFPCLDEDNLEAYFANQKCKKIAARNAILDRFGGVILGAELQSRSSIGDVEIIRYACITPSLSKGGVRVTYYDNRGFSGHSDYRDASEALDGVICEGYREAADVCLDTLAQSDSFQMGNEALAELHRKINGRQTGKEPPHDNTY